MMKGVSYGRSVTGATIKADRAVGTGRSESTRLVPTPGLCSLCEASLPWADQ